MSGIGVDTPPGTEAPSLEQRIESAIDQVLAHGRDITLIVAARDEEIAAARVRADKELEAPQAALLAAAQELFRLWKSNRNLLVSGKSRSHNFSLAQIGERLGQAGIEVLNEELAMKSLRSLGLVRRFTRVKRTLNARALLEAWQSGEAKLISRVKGLSLRPAGETFFIKPKDGVYMSWSFDELDPPPPSPEQLQLPAEQPTD